MSRQRKAVIAAVTIALCLLLIGLTAVIAVQTDWFRNYVKRKIVTATEDALGGTVQIGSFSFDVSHFRAVVTNFVIHGNEPASAAPLLSAARVEVDFRLFTSFKHLLDVTYLGVDNPQANILVLPDGSTNIPSPKQKQPDNNNTALETVVDLAVGHFNLSNGLLNFNSQKQQFDLRGANLHAELWFNLLSRNYSGKLAMDPIYLVSGRNTPVQFRLTLPIALERDRITLKDASVSSGASNIALNASIENLRNPKLTAHLNGHIGLVDVKNAANLPLILNARQTPTSLDLDVNAQASGDLIQVTGLRMSLGHSTVEASGSFKDLKGSGPLQFKTELALGELGRLIQTGVRPDGQVDINGTARLDAGNRYDITGNVQARNLSFVQGTQRFSNIKLDSALHVDPSLISLQGLRLNAFGGEFFGDVALRDFAKYGVSGKLSGFDIQALAKAAGQSQLPYDGIVSGPVSAAGDLNTTGTKGIAAQARLTISPTRRGIPLSGRLEAAYNGAADTVSVNNSFLALPHTRLTLNGSLNRSLQISLTSKDLNDLLAATSPPTKSPVIFDNGGQATFTGTVAGSLTAPRVSGHLDVNRFSVEGRPFQDLAADLVATSFHAALQNGTLTRSSTQAQFSASVGLRNWKALPTQPVTANASVHSSDLGDLVVLAGQPSTGYSGSLTAAINVDGTIGNPRGSVNVQAANGTLYNNRFDQAALQVNLADRLATLSSAYITSGPSRINLTGDFQHPRDSFTTGQIHAHLQSNAVDLAQVRSVQQAQPNSGGMLQADADLTATLATVQQQTEFLISELNADISAKSVKVDGQTYGDLTATARTNGQSVTYNATSDFAGSDLHVTGSTQLTRDYPTTADAKLSHLSLQRILTLAKQNIPATGSLSGTAHFSGTIASPAGNIDLDLANPVVYDEPLTRIHATAAYATTSLQVSRLEVVDGAARIDLSGRFDHPASDLKSGSLQFKIDSSRIDLAKLHNIQKLRPGLGGDLHIEANGAGTLSPGAQNILFSSLNANVAATALSLQKTALGQLTFKAETASANHLSFALDSNLAGSTIHGQGTGQLSGDYPIDARLTLANVTWARLQPLLGPPTGEPSAFDAATDGTLTISGPIAKTDRLRGALELTRLTVDSRPQPGQKSIGIHNQGPIALALNQGVISISSAHLAGPQTDIQAFGSASLTKRTLNVNLNANLNLVLLQSFNRDIVSSGTVVANAGVNGSFAKPEITGQVQLQKASLNYTEFPNGISNANGVIVLNGTNATIRNLQGESGGGRITASGFLAFADGLRFGLRARASQVRIRIQQGVSVVGNSDVQLTGTLDASTLGGSVTVTQLTYSPKSDIGALLSRSNTPVETFAPPSPLLDNMKLDIHVTTAASLGVQASVAQNLDATADLRVGGTAAQPGVLGRVTITEGQLVFFGSTYTVNSGSIAFYNPLKIVPVLNVNLETQAKGVDVVLTVTGPIDNMKLSYTSDPPLQFQEIVGLLAAGQTPTSDPTLLANQPVQPSQSYAQMGESAIVGKALADPVTNRLQRVFGISQLKVDPAFVSGSSVPTARLTFQQQISSNVTFTYTSDLDEANSTIIRAEWSFNPRYSAVATRDQNGIISVLLYYKRQIR